MILKFLIWREMVKIGGRWKFSAVAVVPPPFLHLLISMTPITPKENLGVSYDCFYSPLMIYCND